jgi:hypothetical protein
MPRQALTTSILPSSASAGAAIATNTVTTAPIIAPTRLTGNSTTAAKNGKHSKHDKGKKGKNAEQAKAKKAKGVVIPPLALEAI